MTTTQIIRPNMKFTLEAKTRHGKNRISEHGETWLVIRECTRTNRVLLKSRTKSFKCKKTRTRSHDLRWVDLDGNDRDFTITAINN